MSTERFETSFTNNWSSSNPSEPTLMLNPNAPIINRVGFAWGIAANLELVTDLMLESSDEEISRFSAYVNGQAQILTAMLTKLGDELAAAGGAK